MHGQQTIKFSEILKLVTPYILINLFSSSEPKMHATIKKSIVFYHPTYLGTTVASSGCSYTATYQGSKIL